jgi:glycosyltransferase involved in cell wall biosynthesis
MPPEVSIIIPTLNEGENLPVLVPRIAAALAGRRFEILIIDDSSADNTPEVCRQLSRDFPLRLMIRQPENGLSGAVLQGLQQASGEYLVVMDADLQHPPESIPDLLQPLETDESDFTIGSRYISGGTTHTKWSLFRKINSRAATLLARPIAGDMHDPMSGFFALRRETFQRARQLTPLGYKIGLELICKCGIARPREIAIHFADRNAGVSKLSVKQQFKYLEHLSRLYDFFFPRIAPVIKFIIATASAWLVGFAVYLLALGKTRSDGEIAPPPAVAIAYAAAIITTAAFHLRYTRTQRQFLIRPHPWRDFAIISLCEWSTAAVCAIFCSRRLMQVTAGELFVYSFFAATITRYILRKEFLQDLRGLRKGLREEEMHAHTASKPALAPLQSLKSADFPESQRPASVSAAANDLPHVRDAA